MSDGLPSTGEIEKFYALGFERDRLTTGPGALEYLRTQAILDRYLPAPPAVIADLGGGPGRYAVWLAERGFRVHLIDPIPLHVEQAEAAVQGRPNLAPVAAQAWRCPRPANVR